MKCIAVALILLSIPAMAAAADLAPKPAEPAAPIVQAPFSWTGFYLGLNAGYGGGTFKSRASRTGNEFVEGGPIPFVEDLGTFDDTTRGFVGGGQGGYNYQFDQNFVIGAEADIQYSDIRTNDRSRDLDFVSLAAKTSLPWFGTARLRAGYAFDNLLIYGTGGLAYGRVKEDVATNFGPEHPGISDDDTRTGWTAGGGVEYAIDEHWSLKAEYLYVDLGKTRTFSVPVPVTFGATNVKINVRPEIAIHTFRIGLNYRF